jgi:hypothetical protein
MGVDFKEYIERHCENNYKNSMYGYEYSLAIETTATVLLSIVGFMFITNARFK